jgi:hypothetical protein
MESRERRGLSLFARWPVNGACPTDGGRETDHLTTLRLETLMSDPQVYPDDDREVDAEGIDPDIPSTDDERIVADDDDELDRGDEEIDLADLP